MKLIKLSEEHYIIVDDSEIQIGDWYIDDVKSIRQSITSDQDYWSTRKEYKKITHSTQPLEEWKSVSYGGDGTIRKKIYDKIKPLSLPEVKELLGEDRDTWNKKFEYLKKVNENIKHKSQDERILIFGASDLGFTAGYKQALEDNKEKKYTETDIKNAIIRAYSIMGNRIDVGYFNEVIQSLQPETEWEVEFVEGKLKLV